jgi:hypothetical protein
MGNPDLKTAWSWWESEIKIALKKYDNEVWAGFILF